MKDKHLPKQEEEIQRRLKSQHEEMYHRQQLGEQGPETQTIIRKGITTFKASRCAELEKGRKEKEKQRLPKPDLPSGNTCTECTMFQGYGRSFISMLSEITDWNRH